MISLFLLLVGFDFSSTEAIAKQFGSVHTVRYTGEVEFNNHRGSGELLSLTHEYSLYDKAQSDGALEQNQIVAGIVGSEVEGVGSTPVLGVKVGEKITLRPFRLFNSVVNRFVTMEELRLWVQSQAPLEQSERYISFVVKQSTVIPTRISRAAGYAKFPENSAIAALSFQSLGPDRQLLGGVLSVGWPYRAREKFFEQDNPFHPTRFWKLGKVLEEKEISADESGLRAMAPADWASVSQDVFGSVVSIDRVLSEAKSVSATPQLTNDLKADKDGWQDGNLSDAVGCAASQMVHFPLIGRKIDSSYQFMTFDWHPSRPGIFRIREVKVQVDAQGLFGKTVNEQFQDDQPPRVDEGRLRLVLP